MDEIKVHDIVIQSKETNLTITDESRPGLSIVLNSESLPEIIEFLRSHRPNADEKRNGFRVPVECLCEATRSNFKFSIEINGEHFEATAVDVSITGILIDHTELNFEVGESYSATLSYQDKTATVGATVVRCDGSRTSFHFPETLCDGELEPPESLMQVYRALEIDWLKERVS